MNFALPITPPDRITGLVRGAPSAGGGIELPVFYPATGAQVSTLIEDDARAVDAAIAAARAAFDRGPWPHLGVPQRIEVLEACRETILTHAEDLARLECAATGLILRELRERHIKRAAYNFRFFGEFISQSAGQSFDQTPGYMTTVSRVPVGVAALIAPWNAPVALATMKIAAALAFGNTCVLKPSEQTPLALARLVALLQEVLPEGVLNLVNGRGPVTGAALVAHEGVDRVSFTGGTETGRAIMSAAGRNLVPCTLELGGKSANIVFDDADLDTAATEAVKGFTLNAGQVCSAGTRVLVQRSVYDAFLAKVKSAVEAIVPGDNLGPIITPAQFQRVQGYFKVAEQDGARCLHGGAAAGGEGFYIQPTVYADVSNDMRIAQEEIFGPVGVIIPFDTEEDAIRIANDSDYGLIGTLWSQNISRALRVADRIDAGQIFINVWNTMSVQTPFGGYKNSGYGREKGIEAIHHYSHLKTVTVKI